MTTEVSTINVSDPIFFKNYDVLFNDQRYLEFWPGAHLTMTEKMNAIVRLSIYISVLLSVITQKYTYVYIAIFTILVVYFLYTNEQTKEHFEFIRNIGSGCGQNSVEQPPADYTVPTNDNPFMNINLITDDRNKPLPAPATEEIKNEIEEKFNHSLYRDTDSLYNTANSQREFYTVANNKIPNDQTTFAKWLYKVDSTCKENNLKCTTSDASDERFE